MAVDERSEDNFPPEIDALYEARASQEKAYMDESEEEVVEIIEVIQVEYPAVTQPGEPVGEDVEMVIGTEADLISEDGDDPPPSEEAA